MMKTIYHIFSEKLGEWDAMFDEDDKLLGYWHCNDAHWRNEYFSGFMAELGIEVLSAYREDVERYQRLENIFRLVLIEDGNYNEEDDA